MAEIAKVQYGVGTKNGSQCLVTLIEHALESHPDWVCAQTDIQNAFGSIHREAILAELNDCLALP
eukprot:560617-Amphidinium_carterae.1